MKTIEFKSGMNTQKTIDIKDGILTNTSDKRMTLRGKKGCLIIEPEASKQIRAKINAIFHGGDFYYCQDSYEIIIDDEIMITKVDQNTILLEIE